MIWDIRGKRVLVTGATSGIGLAAARSLAGQGARVVMVGRDAAKTARCLEELRAGAPGADLSSLLCDFSSQAEIRRLADEVLHRYDRLDVLVNNAGTGVTVNCLHPGAVDTGIWSGAPLWTKPLIAIFRRFAFISAEEGGRRIVQLVTSPELSETTGQYFENGRLAEPAPLARDEGVARRLWQESERLTGLGPTVSRATASEPVAAAAARS